MSDDGKQIQEAAKPPVKAWEITAHADGHANLVVEAATEEEAVDIAYTEHLTGIDIGCGVAIWDIDDVREVES